MKKQLALIYSFCHNLLTIYDTVGTGRMPE